MYDSRIRQFDIDDMMVLAALANNKKFSEIAKILGVTVPAVSHRVRKFRTYYPDLFRKATRGKSEAKQFTEEGKLFADKWIAALQTLLGEE